MRNIFLFIIAVLGGYIGSHFFNQNTEAPSNNSAFDRVIENRTIRCGYASWAPFLQKEPNTGELSGFNVSIFNQIGKELGLKIDWVEEVGYGNYIEGLNAGRYDAMCQTVWPDAGRFTNALVTLPVHYHKVHVIVRADDKRFANGYSNLNSPDFTIVVIEGDITETIAKTDFPNAKLVRLPQNADASQLFLELVSNKSDAMFIDWGFFNSYDKTNPGKLKTAGNVLRVYGSIFSVKSGEIALKALLDSAIIALVNNGKIKEILEQHPTTAMPPAPTYIDAGKQ